MDVWIWIAIVIGVSLISVIATLVIVKRQTVKKINYMFDAFEDGETNFKFHEKDSLNKSLNRLRGIFERQKISNEQESWTKLIRVLTHEIMNTLSPVVSLTDALTRHPEIRNDENLKESIDIISDSSVNLMEFVKTYRQITGIAKPVRKKVDLKKIVEKTVRLNEEFLDGKNVKVAMHFPSGEVEVFADEIQIGQIIQNLIKNSWQAGASIIEFDIKLLSDESVILWVKNNGEPIPVEVQEQIFIPFYTTKTDGSGIGLSVCRQIMRYHKGSIDLMRSNNSETVFELSFN